MPSPFPGMDPYLENPDLWPDVHHELISGIREQLAPQLRPRYVARVELTTFVVESGDPAEDLYIIPDVRVVERSGRRERSTDAANPVGGGVALAETGVTAPIDVTGRVLWEARHRYLEIRDVTDRRVVTVIEIVSPSNKVVGSAGRRAFRRKRDEVHESNSSWLEIDLLRAGTRTISVPGLEPSAYFAFADRVAAETDGEPTDRQQLVWRIGLRQRLPVLSVPLRPGDPVVKLDLQAVLNAAYDRAGYDLEFDYTRPPASPLEGGDAIWAESVVASWMRGAGGTGA